jgi:hypothetical protein
VCTPLVEAGLVEASLAAVSPLGAAQQQLRVATDYLGLDGGSEPCSPIPAARSQ